MELEDLISIRNISIRNSMDTFERNTTLKNQTNLDNITAQVDMELFEKYYYNRSVSDIVYWSLIIAYSILIFAGFIGNLLVIFVVINNKSKSIH